MIYSVIPFADIGITVLPTLGWGFRSWGALFLVGGIVAGIAYGMGEAKVAERFTLGAADLLGVAFIIGLSRGITTIMNDGLITDTVLFGGEKLLSGTNSCFYSLFC